MNLITFNLLISSFLFFRYIRANKTIFLFLPSLFFTAFAIYESRHNIILLIILSFWACLQIIVAYLKEKEDIRIKKLQKGYKPSEIVIHFIGFFIIVLLISFIQYKFLGGSR